MVQPRCRIDEVHGNGYGVVSFGLLYKVFGAKAQLIPLVKAIRDSSMLCVPMVVLCFFLSGNAFADISDVYGDYIGRIVPVTHDVARKTARAKELSLFVAALSSLQNRLTTASKHSVQIAAYLEHADSSTTEPCPRGPDGLVQLERVFKNSAALIQAVNHTQTMTQAVLQLQEQLDYAKNRCAAANTFESYDESELGFSFVAPKKPGLFDGVYIVYAEGENGGGNGVEAIPLIGSIVRMVRNGEQQSKIDELTNRLNGSRARTADFRRYAKEACGEIFQGHSQVILDYGALIQQLNDFIRTVPQKSLLERAERIQKCSEGYETQLASLLKQQAIEVARRKFGREEDEARFWLRYAETKTQLQAITQKARGAEEKDCGSLNERFRILRRFSDLARLLGSEQDPLLFETHAAANQLAKLCWGIL
jgi:hypothetical protein